MPIKAETTVTEKVYKDMYKYSLLKKPLGLIVTTIIFLCTFFLIVAGIIMVQNSEDQFFSYFVLVLGLALFVTMVVQIFFLSGFRYKKSVAELAKKTQHFTFEEDFFAVRTKQEEEEAFSKIKYSNLHRVNETKHYFYIYISSRQAYIVIKDQIENASSEQLRQLLQGSVEKKKYKIL